MVPACILQNHGQADVTDRKACIMPARLYQGMVELNRYSDTGRGGFICEDTIDTGIIIGRR